MNEREKRIRYYISELTIMSQELSKWRGLAPDEMVEGANRFARDITALLKESLDEARAGSPERGDA